MKLMLALSGIILAVCPLAVAQDTGGRVVVPARNSSRPRKVDVSLTSGNVTVKAYSGKDVIVESASSEKRSERRQDSGGMRRIDLPSRGLTVEEEDNVITVRTRMPSDGDVVISVPADTSLTARSHNGRIEADGLRGEFDVQTYNGGIALTNVSGTVVAHAANGSIKVVMERVEANKPLSFSSLNGSIDVTLPADVKANVKLNTFRGEIWSDFDIKLGAGAATQPNNTPDGKFRVTMDRNLGGTINGGGVDISFHSLNGKITIRKK